jgi:hypothetical protein
MHCVGHAAHKAKPLLCEPLPAVITGSGYLGCSRQPVQVWPQVRSSILCPSEGESLAYPLLVPHFSQVV